MKPTDQITRRDLDAILREFRASLPLIYVTAISSPPITVSLDRPAIPAAIRVFRYVGRASLELITVVSNDPIEGVAAPYTFTAVLGAARMFAFLIPTSSPSPWLEGWWVIGS